MNLSGQRNFAILFQRPSRLCQSFGTGRWMSCSLRRGTYSVPDTSHGIAVLLNCINSSHAIFSDIRYISLLSVAGKILFVCVEVLRPSQPNGVMSSAVSLPNHTFTGQALPSKRLTSIVHILSPETDNCPS